MNKSELCINLWFCFDRQTDFVDALAGRGYFLSGTDEQKTSMLKDLAVSDYVNVAWQRVPDRYHSVLVDTSKNESESFSGVVHVSDLEMLGMNLFEDVFTQIESVKQTYGPIKNAGAIKVPGEPLYVITPVEKFNGKIRVIGA
jgi:hypothetical protein